MRPTRSRRTWLPWSMLVVGSNDRHAYSFRLIAPVERTRRGVSDARSTRTAVWVIGSRRRKSDTPGSDDPLACPEAFTHEETRRPSPLHRCRAGGPLGRRGPRVQLHRPHHIGLD